MSDFGTELARLMAARGVGVRELARMVPCNPGHISNLRSGKARPSAELAEALDERLKADGSLRALIPAHERRRPQLAASWDDSAVADEIAAVELGRLAKATEVGTGTVERLELAVDELAIAYPSTPSADLYGRVRGYLRYVGRLLDARMTLAEHRRLLVVGGWLSLLAATTLIDLHRDQAAAAHLRTAAQLARESEHTEIAAWCLETQAWQVLTAGDYQRSADISQAAQRIAPKTGSAFIQATAQEGRAWARLGAGAQTRGALSRVEALVSPLPMPERPEHHYLYDPPKAQVYVATTLSWLGDTAAEGLSRQVLAAIEAPQARPRPRRAALARLDLALALTGAGKHDEAAGVTLEAIRSGRLAPVDGRRAREIVLAVAERGVPEAAELAEAYQAACGDGGGRPALP
jgi:transcriptional regulator with XRE-family HTH domain